MDLKAQAGTASDGRLTEQTRPMADAIHSNRCESVNPFEYPRTAVLKRAWGWQGYHLAHGPNLGRMAFHEAGHVVLLEWLGIGAKLATATQTGGVTHLPAMPTEPPTAPDPTGELTATGAAVFHAGVMAELLHAGAKWAGPIFRPMTDDHRRAEAFLSPEFGSHSSGAHAFAQLLALHVLADRWHRVAHIAQCLIERGEWRPGEADIFS